MVTLYYTAFHYRIKGIKRKISPVILNVMDLDDVLIKHLPNYRFRDTPDPYFFVDYDSRIQILLIVSFLKQLIFPAQWVNVFYKTKYHQQAGIHIKNGESIDEVLNKCIQSHDETEKIKREQFDTDENTKQLTVKFIW